MEQQQQQQQQGALGGAAGGSSALLSSFLASTNLQIEIPVHQNTVRSAGARYRVYTEVWGRRKQEKQELAAAAAAGAAGGGGGGGGEEVPVAWLSRMVSIPAGDSSVTVQLDLNWVLKAGVDPLAPLALRNLVTW